jgi:peptide/nickel transport system permease protein
MALLIRYVRGNLLDVLGMPYIQTARAKGLKERIVIWKHALRNAINPLISIMGFWIPSMFEGTLVAAIILNWPIMERIYWKALQEQDEYLIMTGLLFFGTALLIGNLIADLLLAWSDPRIRYD